MTSIDLFDYHLPQELIAQRPPKARDESRLMTLERGGGIGHHGFRAFPWLLRPTDTLVLNNTKVIKARIMAQRRSGGKAEILLAQPLGAGEWKAMVRGSGRLKAGESLTAGGCDILIVSKLEDGLVHLSFGSERQAQSIISAHGQTPLPPYIKREDAQLDNEDLERYQTVYASNPGACAAPTAGMHFTPAILEAIGQRGINIAQITLHTGPGTFLPVKSESIEDHIMHPEYYEIPAEAADAINRARQTGGRIVAVGSTVVRALESATGQDRLVRSGQGQTSLFITPGFEFRVVGAMLTNFHLPRSTLLVMVSAFAGRERILAAYNEAVREKYRFFSYGDAIFIT